MLCGIVFVNGNHWNCFFAKQSTQTFVDLDPAGKTVSTISTIENAFDSWKYVFKNSIVFSKN